MSLALLACWLAAAQAPQSPGEPGTRLEPFGEDLPARGPLGPRLTPPLRLANLSLSSIPPGELTDEERAVLLRRARLAAGDRGLFSEGPKDPWKAVALSAEAVALSLVVPPLWVVAGSLGEAYAGNWLDAVLMSSVRLGFGIWIVVEGVALLGALSSANNLSAVQSAASNLNLATGIGGTVILGTSAAELLTVFGVAERANDRWEEKVLAGASAGGVRF